MKYTVDSEIYSVYPDLYTGIAVLSEIRNSASSPEVTALLAEAEARLRAGWGSRPASEHPHVAAWRAAYSTFGVKPSQYRSAVEALARRVLKGEELPHINKLVDLGNCLSVKYVLPIAAYDLDQVTGDILIKFATGDEKFVPLGTVEVEHPEPGEVVYTDSNRQEALSRRWNWRQADKAKAVEETKRVLLTVEGVNRISRETVERATQELIELIQRFCGGKAQYSLLYKEEQEAEFEV
jgi:DNA/RNA-binding domain of Phe-tRNA-synthetase-like protein